MHRVSKLLSMFAAILFVALVSAATLAGAQTTDNTKPMALRGVMDKLDRDMQIITGAISREDWPLVAEVAPKIAHHAEPPLAEKVRILAWLGTDARKFRGFDEQTHEAANAMGQAATRSDGQAVIAAFANAQQSCLACHQGFRKSFSEHFYGKR